MNKLRAIGTPLFALLIAYSAGIGFTTAYGEPVKERLLEKGELMPFPEARPLLKEIAATIDSPELKNAIESSRTLQMLRERVRTSLFHLNFRFDVTEKKYPYRPPFEAPFPFRPTLEAMEEASQFLNIVEKTTGFRSTENEKIENSPYTSDLKVLFPESKPQSVVGLSKEQIGAEPVDAYVQFQKRLKDHGESASFPEFSESVTGMLNELQSEEVKAHRASDPAFNLICEDAIAGLQEVQKPGAQSKLYGAHSAPYPYRKTIQAVERALMAVDLKERLKYPEGINWHDVEVSWFVGNAPKLLPLYHFNRYKYQMAGLLADHEVVLWPFWGGTSFEYLTRLRAAPIGVMEVSNKTDRIDRHHNSPLDNYFHDANHVRRMWGYDQRKQEKRGAKTPEEKIAIYREQDQFVKGLLKQTDPKAVPKGNAKETNARRYERVLVFETIHETALTPDRDSLLQDLLRKPATPQPFEVQVQTPIEDLELIRSFDGNLKSGADQLGLNLDRPTTIRYFYDRAPGFLANVDNKLRWGFYDSPFNMKNYVVVPKYRKPMFGAEATLRMFQRLGYSDPPSRETLLSQLTDHGGQPELWNYFGVNDANVVRTSGLNALNVAAAEDIHSTWRRNSLYEERWKPTNAKLKDGTIVQDQRSLEKYFEEKGIPHYLHQYYRLDENPVSGETILFEDIRNLPNEFLAANHQGENLMSGAKAVSVVDRLWQKARRFRDLDSVERWLVAAAQAVHQAVLDRNANGSRNNPVYNQHWLSLPAQNQINDLELVRIAFEARQKVGKKKMPVESVTIFQEGLSRLYRKIRRGEVIRTCNAMLSGLRNSRIADGQ